MSKGYLAMRIAVAVSPAIGALPGTLGTMMLAAPSCGFQFLELQELYPSASGWLRTVAILGVAVWAIWAVAFLRSTRWNSVVNQTSLASRLGTVGSLFGGIALGIAISLAAYSLVAGVEDMCLRVQLPITLLWVLILIVPAFLLYVVIEVVFDARRQRSGN